MDNTKFTKGQWYVSGGDKYATIESRNMDEKIVVTYPTIATVNSTFINFEEFRANALLISKAPEMLEMLKELIHAFEGENLHGFQEERLAEAKKLIKEATELWKQQC